MSASSFPNMNHQLAAFFCCVINPLTKKKALERESQITTCHNRTNASRQEVTAAITRVSVSLCRMLEDDLKISSDEEEAEQQVSSLCCPSSYSAAAYDPSLRLLLHLSFSVSSTSIAPSKFSCGWVTFVNSFIWELSVFLKA